MKKTLIILVLLTHVFALFAQNAGDMVVSGSLSWNSNSTKWKSDNESSVEKGLRSFSIIPEFHYFVSDRFSIGAGIGYALTKTPNGSYDMDDDEDVLFNKLGFFVFQPVAQYYVSLNDKFYYVPRFYIGFGVGKYKEEQGRNTSYDLNASVFNIGLSLLNFEFKPADKIGIRFSAGDLDYKSTCIKDDDDKQVDRNFGLNFNLGATVGFNFYF
ncbi:MAG: hypothetical protein K2I90_11820 [Odoribacter sp.]|nr:hypothetical protein [Odoribacter sp.]